MTVRVEKNGAVWTVVMHRPHARNAVDPETSAALYDAFQAFDADADAAVAVFHGDGGAFCAGYDLKHAAQLGEDKDNGLHDFPDDDAVSQGPMGPTRLDLDKPVIASIAGPAVAGGMELALWCDLRVMEHSAYMGVYCRRWGVPLVDGGTVRLARLIGESRAMDLVLTGRRIDSAECADVGLANYRVEDGTARDAAEALAHQLAQLPQHCMRADRRSVRHQHGASTSDALRYEWQNGIGALSAEGIASAARFSAGAGRHGAPEE